MEPNRRLTRKLFLFFEEKEMWIGSSEPPSWWPIGFPDIYVTDSPETIKEKVRRAIRTDEQQDGGDTSPPSEPKIGGGDG